MKIKKNKDNIERKYFLREFARSIGLSEEIALRKKKSAQYGTGIIKIMKKIAKENNMSLGEYIKSIK